MRIATYTQAKTTSLRLTHTLIHMLFYLVMLDGMICDKRLANLAQEYSGILWCSLYYDIQHILSTFGSEV